MFASRLPGRSTPRTRLTSVFGKAPTAHLAWHLYFLALGLHSAPSAPSRNSPDRLYVSTVLTIKREKGRSLPGLGQAEPSRASVSSLWCCYCSSHVAMEYLPRALCERSTLCSNSNASKPCRRPSLSPHQCQTNPHPSRSLAWVSLDVTGFPRSGVASPVQHLGRYRGT